METQGKDAGVDGKFHMWVSFFHAHHGMSTEYNNTLSYCCGVIEKYSICPPLRVRNGFDLSVGSRRCMTV